MASTSLVWVRIIGIAFASASSGMGELTFLQLTTSYGAGNGAGGGRGKDAVGAWASGTGGAGIIGAGAWWILRRLGTRMGLAISSLLPLGFPVVWYYLLPSVMEFGFGFDGEGAGYDPVFVVDDDASEISMPVDTPRKVGSGMGSGSGMTSVVLTWKKKVDLVKPLVLRYMVWVFLVYAFEYTINSGE